MKHFDPAGVMANLPTLPSGVTPGQASLWAVSIVVTAALERGWAREDLRKSLLSLATAFATAVDASIPDEQLHAEFQYGLDRNRARFAKNS